MSFKACFTIACIFAACAPPPKYVREGDKVTKALIAEMQTKHALIPLGKGGGVYANKKIDALYVDFELDSEVTSSCARELLADVTDSFLRHINESEALLPYLTHHPFSLNDLSVSIAFVDKTRRPRPSLAQIHTHEGKIALSKFVGSNFEIFHTED